MKDNTNVIPFPKPQPSTKPGPQVAVAPKSGKSQLKWNSTLAATVCSLIAIALAAGATNSSLFAKTEGYTELTSLGEDRSIASVEQSSAEERDAAWEKSVAESLASADVRDVASVSVGHEASLDETVRYGILERKYTILRDLKRNEVESVILQGTGSEPSMLRDRSEFLGKYGRWISDKYGSSKLASTENVKDGKIESFMVYDNHHKPFAVARFELDRFQRLLALHFDPLTTAGEVK